MQQAVDSIRLQKMVELRPIFSARGAVRRGPAETPATAAETLKHKRHCQRPKEYAGMVLDGSTIKHSQSMKARLVSYDIVWLAQQTPIDLLTQTQAQRNQPGSISQR